MTASRQSRLARERIYLIAVPPPGARPDGAQAWYQRLAAVSHAGIGLFQLRAKEASTAERRAWLHGLREHLPAQALLVVNDDFAAVHDDDGRLLADGAHLGREDARRLLGTSITDGLRAARAQLGPGLLLGTSTRTLDELLAAREAGADHAGFGALAASPTKPDSRPADPHELRRCSRALPGFPLFPIGGLGPHNLQLLERTGVRRLAVSSAILDAEDPVAVARTLLAWAAGQR